MLVKLTKKLLTVVAYGTPTPERVKDMVVLDANDVEKVTSNVDFVFSAVSMSKDEIKALKKDMLKLKLLLFLIIVLIVGPRCSMIIPEINPEHTSYQIST